jgi:glycine cleavage system protein P-like pyridoxal-binding family
MDTSGKYSPEQKASLLTKAEESYLAATQKDPKFVFAYYNVGVLHYNKAAEWLLQADKAWRDAAKSKELMDKGIAELKLSLPQFRKVYEIEPTNVDALTQVRNIYRNFQNIYRNQNNSEKEKEMEDLYNKYNEELKKLQ